MKIDPKKTVLHGCKEEWTSPSRGEIKSSYSATSIKKSASIHQSCNVVRPTIFVSRADMGPSRAPTKKVARLTKSLRVFNDTRVYVLEKLEVHFPPPFC